MKPSDEQVFARDGFRCVYCDFDGRSFDGWTFLQVDHFNPKCHGGGDELENLKTSCIICNAMKGAYSWPTLEEARAKLAEWRQGMRKYWEDNVRKLVAEP